MGWNVTGSMAKFPLVHFGQVMARAAEQLSAHIPVDGAAGRNSVSSCPVSNRHLRMAKWGHLAGVACVPVCLHSVLALVQVCTWLSGTHGWPCPYSQKARKHLDLLVLEGCTLCSHMSQLPVSYSIGPPQVLSHSTGLFGPRLLSPKPVQWNIYGVPEIEICRGF